MMSNIGSYFKVVDADEHRIIEELRCLREKKRKDAHDITAADAAKAKSIRIREGYARANELRKNKPIEEALIFFIYGSVRNHLHFVRNQITLTLF